MRRCSGWAALLLATWAGLALAQPGTATKWRYDPGNARDILETCAACHGKNGKNGEGGKDGTCPRLAGQYAEYLRRQIESFQSGERANADMDDVFDSLDGRDLDDIFAHLSSRDD